MRDCQTVNNLAGLFELSQTDGVTLCLGIDVGSTTTKVALVDVRPSPEDGGPRVLRVGQVPTPDTAPALRDALAELIRSCISDAGGPIAAIGVASMAETGVPLAADGTPLTPFQRWDRATGREHLDRLRRRHPDLLRRTGLPATPKPTLVALTRLRGDAPDVFARLARWQGVADHVVAILTGAHVTDHTLAARTMLRRRGDAPGDAAQGDAAQGGDAQWDSELVDAAGIREGVLPRIVAAGEAAGRTTSDAAAFGLPPGIPVYVAGHDHAVGAWSAGVRSPGEVADSLGTAEAVLAVTDEAAETAVDDGFSIGRSVDDRHDTVMGGSPACGALLAAWPTALVDVLAAEDPSHWRTSPAIVLPYPRGRQCPSPDPDATLVTIGVDGSDPDDVSAHAVLQSLVLHARWMREAAGRHAGISADRMVLLGSLAARIRVWAPLTAAAAARTPSGPRGVAVARCATREPVAAGAALLAAVREGLAPADVALPVAEVAPTPAPGLHAAYERFVSAATTPPSHSQDPDTGAA